MSTITQFPIPSLSISQISPVSAATMTDAFPVTQDNVTGLENLSQVFSLFLPALFLNFNGNPNGNLAGIQNQICYDTLHNVLYVCTVTGTSTSAVWKTSIPIVNTTNLTVSSPLVSNNSYIANGSGVLNLSLPSSSNAGDIINIYGLTGGWSITQGSLQQIIVSPTISTLGNAGSVSSSHIHDCISLVCIVANTVWNARSWTGSGLTIV